MNKQITDKFTNSVLSINDVAINKLETLYMKQYNMAIDNYLETIGEDKTTFYENNIILNRSSKSFEDAPIITIMTKESPFKKTVVDLSLFWPKYIFNTADIPILYNEELDYGEYELTHIDYARKKAIFKNRYNSVIAETSLNTINKYTKVSDELSLDNKTFRNLLDSLHDKR